MERRIDQLLSEGKELCDYDAMMVKRCMSMLLKNQFVFRRKNKLEFDFIYKNNEKWIAPLFCLIGFEVDMSFCQEGVIGLRTEDGSFMQEALGDYQVAVMLILRDLYARDRSLATEGVFVSKDEILEQLQMYGVPPKKANERAKSGLEKCRKLHLIEDRGDSIEILPSVKITLGLKSIDEAMDKLEEKLKEKTTALAERHSSSSNEDRGIQMKKFYEDGLNDDTQDGDGTSAYEDDKWE